MLRGGGGTARREARGAPMSRFVKAVAGGIVERFDLHSAVYKTRARLKYLTSPGTRRHNAEFLERGAPDGLPLPPPHMVFLVAGHFDLEIFYEASLFHAALIRSVLTKNGFDIAGFAAILDFG